MKPISGSRDKIDISNLNKSVKNLTSISGPGGKIDISSLNEKVLNLKPINGLEVK